MSRRPVLLAAVLAVAPIAVPAVRPTAAYAQTVAEQTASGDREREMNPVGALTHYQAALKADPTDYDALTKAAYATIEVGQAASDKDQQRAYYKQAEDLARRAITARPTGAEGHFVLATALGRTAQTLGARDRIRYASDVRTQALEALKYDPRHAGALHVMGMWNAEVMRLSGISRFMAKNFLGGQVFSSASWDDAQRYLEQAVQIEPQRITHRIDLAQVYLDRGDKAKAREQLDAIAAAPARELNDANYKRQAEALRGRAS
ncbi:MAG TPA: tetratricopeptide repeat protein [Gemmatirosa sp.]